jgi:HTH-type transcriptional regulator/antitoxin HigA
MNVITKDLQSHWTAIRPFFVIHNEHAYDMAVDLLNHLLDEIGTNEQHPLYDFMDTLGAVVHAYEEQHYPIPECKGIEMLQFFMEEHGLSASDLPEIGSPQVVSEIMNGTRELTVSHIRALAERFHVSPAIFV